MARPMCGILGSIEKEKKRTSRPKGGLRWISFETSKAKAAAYAKLRGKEREGKGKLSEIETNRERDELSDTWASSEDSQA